MTFVRWRIYCRCYHLQNNYFWAIKKLKKDNYVDEYNIYSMESIFHEKQEGYLCAQHCLNALLQGPYFNPVDLANLAQQMDDEERIRMAESGIDSVEYRHFIEQPSENMDDSGYFSVQVISSALKVWGLELIPYSSTEPTALVAQSDPSQMQAYICNYKGHWFTIRKIGLQWFNLNSILSGPQLLSDTYLAMFFAQLLQEGYSIFIVIGQLPECPADDILLNNPVTLSPKSKSDSQTAQKSEPVGYRLGTAEEDELAKIQRLQASSSSRNPRERIIPITIEDGEDSQKSLKLCLNVPVNEEERCCSVPDDQDDDEQLRKALQLSLECVTAPPTPDPDDIRWKRLAYLGIHSRTTNTDTTQKLNT